MMVMMACRPAERKVTALLSDVMNAIMRGKKNCFAEKYKSQKHKGKSAASQAFTEDLTKEMSVFCRNTHCLSCLDNVQWLRVYF